MGLSRIAELNVDVCRAVGPDAASNEPRDETHRV